ncbi:MAG: hypothetical protein EOP06_04560, partial [Proteobacteria bacterium]
MRLHFGFLPFLMLTISCGTENHAPVENSRYDPFKNHALPNAPSGMLLNQTGNLSDAGLSFTKSSLSIGHRPVCDHEVVQIELANGSRLTLGNWPAESKLTLTPGDEFFRSNTIALLTSHAEQNTGVKGLVSGVSECYSYSESGELIPVIRYLFNPSANQALTLYKAPYSPAYSIDYMPKSTKIRNAALDLGGYFQVYKDNPLWPVQSLDVDYMSSFTALESLHFKILLEGDTSLRDITTGGNFRFDKTLKPNEFTGANVLVNSEDAYEYLHEVSGFTESGNSKVTVKVNDPQSMNNAYYLPSSSGPQIVLGKSDNRNLRWLSLDADVVHHEYSHHAIAQTLSNLSGFNTVSLHEGLADIFTNLNRKNPCLAPSVCPSSGGICYSSPVNNPSTGLCLRLSDNQLRLRDLTSSSGDPHAVGMVISAFLWDFVKIDGMNHETLSKLIADSVKMLPSSGDISDFVAVFAKTLPKNSSLSCELIIERAVERELILDPRSDFCSDSSATPSLKTSVTPAAVEEAKPSLRKSKPTSCGTISEH